MNNDKDAQFLCKDCERYNLCRYYDRRKEDSYICKYFHLPSTENKGEWIPVTEKLPKDHEEVLIYLSSNRITIGLYNSHVLPLAPYKPIGWGVNAQTAVHNFCSDDVVAWMPLPEPYKAEKGGEE